MLTGETKNILGVLAVVVGFVGYAPYVRDVARGITKPHAMSWVVWGTIEVIVFCAQITRGAGAGAWVTAASATIALGIAVTALIKRDHRAVLLDWVAFAGALFGIVLWVTTSNPLLAVIAVTIADALGFFPTIRKTYHHPHDETLVEYALCVVKWSIGFVALGSLNPTTVIYPVSVIITNGSFVVLGLVRRYQKRQ